ncbi:MAG: hypothetical protein MJ208_03515 [Bacilli bacterium]|nr:hypothetical protein [Bacilli bacterium]
MLSCGGNWKDVDYETAKKFIDDNYKATTVALLPTKVCEEVKITGADDEQKNAAVSALSIIFYSENSYNEFVASKSYEYKADYTPVNGDIKFAPIISEIKPGVRDYLIPSDKDARIATYQTSGKKFKQKFESGALLEYISHTESYTYNDKGYRIELIINETAKGEALPGIIYDYHYEYKCVITY